MKRWMDTEKLPKYNLTLKELLYLINVLTDHSEINIESIGTIEQSLIDKGFISRNGLLMSTPYVLKEKESIVLELIMDSETTQKEKSRLETLADTLRSIYPKEIKDSKYPLRGDKRGVMLKLNKFLKLYGDTWSDEQIIDATKRYIAGFNGDYTYMKTLPYFILKAERRINEEGKGYNEEVSNLAIWLENEDAVVESNNWLGELR